MDDKRLILRGEAQNDFASHQNLKALEKGLDASVCLHTVSNSESVMIGFINLRF